MVELLLQTKLYSPSLRPFLIPRPHLLKKLDTGLNRKLTLISAPAGFGKTTVATDWLAQMERPFVWLSLDRDDNDLARFFTYAAAAVQKIEGVGHTIQGLLQSPQPLLLKSLATAFINDCMAVSTPFLLVLDDYHVITETAVHEAVTFLLDNLPPQLHLVITSRTDPLLPLPRLRARGQMTELRTDDLRFTVSEAADFLQQVMRLNLSVEQVSALESRTEGWIAGLQMAALSIQGLKQDEDVTSFVTDFTGSHRYIFDYLTDEVLQQRPSATQGFLLQTSLLDRFNASLCTAVTGQENSQAILQSLETANLFLFPLDENRQWYRYHHLFADLLRQRLRRRQPELIPELYQRASQWYAEQGDVETAVQYALAGDDDAEAIRLLDQVAFDLIDNSDFHKLLKLAKQLPIETVSQPIRLCLAQAWAYVLIRNLDAAETYVRQAEVNLITAVGLTAEFPEAVAQAQIATIHAFIATRRGNFAQAITFSDEALAWLAKLPTEMTRQLHGTVLINLGQAQAALDEIEKAETAYWQAVEINKANGRVFGTLASYRNIMILQRRQGQLNRAQTIGRQGLAWLRGFQPANKQPYPAEGEIRYELGIIFYEQNQLSAAKAHLEKGRDLYRYPSQSEFSRCLHYLFLVAMAQGQLETAVQLHRQIEPFLNELPPIPYQSHAAQRSERMRRLSLAQPEAAQWLEGLRQWLTTLDPSAPAINNLQEPESLIRAQVLATLDQPEAALVILNQLAEAAETTSRFGDLIHYRLQQSLVLNRLSQVETAVTHLNQAISLAASEGYLRLFLDEADGLRPLLPRLPATPYRDQLIAHLQQESQVELSPAKATPAIQSATLDPLSERELEVLALLATHLSGPEIADQLHISPNTLKTHTRNIYSKLGVNGRNEAVVKAQTSDLL